MNRRSTRPMGSAAVAAFAWLTLTSAIALASVPNSTAYHFSSHPMISGTVVSVNDHQMVVNTDQGEQVTLEVDSKTLAPRDLAPGMVMRTEFAALEDCRFYAQRIMPIRGGMSTSRLQAYANTRDSDAAIARSTSAPGAYRMDAAPAGSWTAPPQAIGEHSPGTVMIATPTTADYRYSTRTMISGGVISVNDHRLVVKTDQGQLVALVMDSNTMVPREVAPGAVLRVEFSPMQDGRYYAKRVSQIGDGVVEREQAYAHTRDSDLLLAANLSDCGSVAAAPATLTSAMVRHEIPVTSQPVAAPAVVETPEVLPQTASGQPLMLLLGLIALGSAGALALARGFRVD